MRQRRFAAPPVRWGAIVAALGIVVALSAGCGTSTSPNGALTTASDHDLTLPPLVVGFATTATGALGNPELEKGAQAAADYVNAKGGINGHPLRLDSCATDGTPAKSVQCANQFVTNKVPIVLNGFDAGIDAAVPVLKQAGITIFGLFGGAAVYADPSAVVLAPPVPSTFELILYTLKQAGVNKLAMMLPSGPYVQQIYDAAAPIAAQTGIETNLTNTNPANPDYTAAFTAVTASGSNGVLLQYGEQGCTDALRAARATGYSGAIVAGDCHQYVEDLGQDAKDVYSLSVLYPYSSLASASDEQTRSQLTTFHDVMETAGLGEYVDTYANYGFATVMTFADIARSITGEFTTQSLGDAAAAFKGRVFLGNDIDCTNRPLPGAACGDGMAILKATGNGTQELVGGKFVTMSDIK